MGKGPATPKGGGVMAKSKNRRADTGKLIGEMLEDLCRRLQEQVNIAERLEAAARDLMATSSWLHTRC